MLNKDIDQTINVIQNELANQQMTSDASRRKLAPTDPSIKYPSKAR